MKAIIPVAGAGAKLRPLTYTQPKPLIPVAGKPIISFIIDQLIASGIQDFVFILGYLGEKIQGYLEQEYPLLNKQFVVQNHRDGSGHAIWLARDLLVMDEPVMIVFGDTIVDVDMQLFIDEKESCLGIKRINDPREFGVVELDAHNNILHMVEKPNIPKSNQAMVGMYKIRKAGELIEALDNLIHANIKTHGEFMLTDGLKEMIKKGLVIKAIEVDNWYDCGKKEILLETNAMLLEKRKNISLSHSFPNTIILEPVNIGEECKISNAIIGPHVTIGDHSELKNVIIRNSIIGNQTYLEDIILHESIIGSDSDVIGVKQSLQIGDNTEIDFS
ncbi:MAG: glucose-1-phosphate thymidylyltransferase [Saprospiraceae bacterium]|jgi:glucose-1-phosphate thymidylyltransferase|nr:glucose-1-phosphate thymidylyltransferase [Saprospiraceae bacterium]